MNHIFNHKMETLSRDKIMELQLKRLNVLSTVFHYF